MEESRVELIEPKNGTRKVKILDETIVYVGPRTTDGLDIPDQKALGDQGRLMIRPAPQGQPGYTLFNLSDLEVRLRPHIKTTTQSIRPFQPHESVMLADQDRVEFGGYQLIYYVGDRASNHL